MTQIIVDECGMCMEPESLIPIVGFKSAQQVALIGNILNLSFLIDFHFLQNLSF